MKPIVHYTPDANDSIAVGYRACVRPVDHYATERVSNTRPVLTSTVQSYDPATGEFETLNTRYRPVEAA